MKKYLTVFLMVLCMPLAAAPETIKDELKENIKKGGNKAIESLYLLREQRRYDLFPDVSALIKKEDTAFIISVLEFYIGFNELEEVYPAWKKDIVWIVKKKNETELILKALDVIRIKKENSLLYLATKYEISNEGRLRRKSYQVMATLKDDRALPFLLQLANSERAIYKYYFLEAVRYYRDERLDSFIVNMAGDESPGIRSKALETLVHLKMTEKFFLLPQKALDDTNYDVRKHSVQLIGKAGLKQFSYVLTKSVFDAHPEVREVSVNSILSMKEKGYAHYISDQLKKEPEDYLKLMMIDCLVALDNHGGGQGLIKILDDANFQVRQKGAQAVSFLNVKAASDKMIAVFGKEENESVRMDFVKSMGGLGDKSFSASLMKILETGKESAEMKKNALDSINKIDDDRVLLQLFELYEAEKTKELKTLMSEVIRQMLKRHHS